MELKQLEALLAIANFKSFKVAANRLGVTQPAISSRIAQLEDELGVALFDRTSRQVRLTVRGFELLQYAERISDLVDKMTAAASDDSSRTIGDRVRIGIPSALVRKWAPRLTQTLRSEHPNIQIEFHVDRSHLLRQLIGNGELDMALVLGLSNDAALRSVPLKTYSYKWIASPQVRLPSRRLSLDEVSRFPVITYAKDSTTYRELEQLFSSHNIERFQLSGSNSSDAIVSIVSSGIALGYVLDTAVERELQIGHLLSLEVDAELSAAPYYACFADEGRTTRGMLLAERASMLARDELF